MEHISNKEKAKQIAKKLSHPNIDSFGDGDDEVDTRFYHTNKDAALEAMQWKDELHSKEKQQWIEKAAEWLKHNIYDYFYWIEMEGESEANIKDTLFDDFKKYAEERI